MKQKKYPVIHMGTVSILVVFIVLCLVTFALLSYMSAKSDYDYANTAAARNTDYYTSCVAATRHASDLEQLLMDSYADNLDTYYNNISAALESSDTFYTIESFDSSAFYIGYTVPVDDESILEIIVHINWPSTPGDTWYQVKSWKQISTREWTLQTGMNLM